MISISTLFNNPFIGIAKVDAKGSNPGIFLDINDAFADMLEYKKEELIGKHFKEITTKDSLDKDVEKLNKTLKGEIDYYTIDKCYITKTNKIIHVFLNVCLIRDKENNPDFFLSQVIDFTPYINLQKEVTKAKEEIEKTNKELVNLIHIISHDLQEPLRSISGFLSILKREINIENPKCFSHSIYVDKAINGAIKLSNMIDSLLDYSKIGEEKNGHHSIKFSDILKEAKNNLSSRILHSNAKIKLKKDFSLCVNTTQFIFLVQNLISNSIKFAKKDCNPIIEIDLIKRKEDFYISFKDNGIGIDEKHLVEIFKVFRKLHLEKSYEGYGLGLSIVKKVAELHNGYIEVNSKVGEGSVFKIILPVDLLEK